MKQLVKLWKRPSHDGTRFTYYLLYTDAKDKRRQKSLGHADTRKAERQRAQFERELRMGMSPPDSMKLNEFLEDSLDGTRGQVRESTLIQHSISMKHFLKVTGDIDLQRVKHDHGERFIQACLDDGNAPATANKKVRSLKRLFQLAVERGQLEQNPFRRLRKPKIPRKKVRIYTKDECERLIESARVLSQEDNLHWDLLVLLALSTGMRRAELLNAVWEDIDFQKQTIDVSPKKETRHTWKWQIKDCDRRTLPLTKEVLLLLSHHRKNLPDGYPYVLVPPARHARIRQLRQEGRLKFHQRACPINNFTRQFRKILVHAKICRGQFHDLRRTRLSGWLASGLSEYDVMALAGHADFAAAHRFYLAIGEDLLQRAREATTHVLRKGFAANLLQHRFGVESQKMSLNVSVGLKTH